jgi:IclR family transcriptional regulator, pca regulon regulatory protein
VETVETMSEATIRTTKAEKAEVMGGLAKGLAIIEAFAVQPVLTIADAAKASGATRAAARRCLLTLRDCGYVEFDGKFFRPSQRLSALGGSVSSVRSLPQVAQPILENVRDALDEAVSLAVLEGDEVLFVARAEASRIVSTGVRIGAHLPAYISATGRVLLAALPDDDVKARLGRAKYERRTPKTLVGSRAVSKAVLAARREGYALGDEEIELGLRAIAVSVRDRSGRTLAAMSVSASSARVSAARMIEEFLPVVRRNANVIGKIL